MPTWTLCFLCTGAVQSHCAALASLPASRHSPLATLALCCLGLEEEPVFRRDSWLGGALARAVGAGVAWVSGAWERRNPASGFSFHQRHLMSWISKTRPVTYPPSTLTKKKSTNTKGKGAGERERQTETQLPTRTATWFFCYASFALWFCPFLHFQVFIGPYSGSLSILGARQSKTDKTTFRITDKW